MPSPNYLLRVEVSSEQYMTTPNYMLPNYAEPELFAAELCWTRTINADAELFAAELCWTGEPELYVEGSELYTPMTNYLLRVPNYVYRGRGRPIRWGYMRGWSAARSPTSQTSQICYCSLPFSTFKRLI